MATWAPSSVSGNDHFVIVTKDTLGAPTSIPPLGKVGGTAAPTASPFLAAESSNGCINWFNTRETTSTTARALGQQMEDTIDIFAAFGGTMPTNLCMSALTPCSARPARIACKCGQCWFRSDVGLQLA